MPQVPSTSDHALGAELRRLRQASGRTVADVATELGWSQSKLSRLETSAISRVGEADLVKLLAIYQVPRDEEKRLAELAGRARKQPPRRRVPYGEALPDVYERFLSLEAEAASISTYGIQLVPGLLQTAEYAGAVVQATSTPDGRNLNRARINARMVRQAVLARVPPPSIRIVMDEAVLLRPIGGADVMRRQMLRLIEASESPSITIRVLPLSIGAHPALSGQFVVLDFADDMALPPQVFCDGLTGGTLQGGSDAVAWYRHCFEQLIDLALPADESLEKFQVTADSLMVRHAVDAV